MVSKNTTLWAQFLFTLLFLISPLHAQNTNTELDSSSAAPSVEEEDQKLFSFNQNNDAPTYITAEQLELFSEKREFKYQGKVRVTQEDLVMTSDSLLGYYNEQNEITSMIALQDVVITKGPTIRATGQRAEYSRVEETLVLTESPELIQQGNVLSADRVKIFLAEDKSVAEGQVRVKILEGSENGEANTPAKERRRQ